MATQVAFSDLDSWLQAQPVNTVDTPYEIEITGLTASDCGDSTNAGTLGYILSINNWNKYVDLRETVFPNMTELYNTFGSCGLVYAPPIPNTVTLLYETYSGCSYLKTAPVIPETVTSMEGCFGNCTSLSEPPTIPSSVRNLEKCFRGCNFTTSPILPNSLNTMKRAFYNCTKLVNAPIIPEGVQYMESAFEGCSLLSHKPIKPSSVQYSSGCYTGVTTKNWKGTSSQVETFNPTCPDDCEIQIYNNDRVTLEDTFLNVDISTLSTYLAGLDPNTVSTAYKIYIRGLTSSNASDINPALVANSTKFVDLQYTTIPESTDCTDLFRGCTTLVKSAILPTNATSLIGTFRQTSLITAPSIPSGVTDMTQTFYGDALMQNAPTIPNGVTTLEYTFLSCEGITTPPAIPSSVTNMRYTFAACNGLTTAPVIPEGVTDITSCFEKIYDESVNFTSISVIPSTVTKGENAFKGCASLTKIDEFKIPLNTLKNNSDFHNMFAGCSSLESIGFKVDADKWHAWRLKFNGNSVEGKIFGFENGQIVSTAIQNTQISQDDIKLPVLTDELWFPDSIMTDSEIEDVVEDVLNNRYTYWKKIVIDPSSKSLVMMASDPDNVVSNFLGNGEGIDVEVINNSKSITLNNDKRLIADGSGITVTLNYNSKVGAVTEIYAMQACIITYYTGQSSTQSWSMSAGTKAVFIYYSGWKLHSNYGTTNSVAVDNMQSVSSNAVYNAIGGKTIKYKDVDFILANMTFTYLSQQGKQFYYCNLPTSNYFTSNQILLNACIVYWSSTPLLIVQFDNNTSSLSFQTNKGTFESGAWCRVRYLYIET